MKNNNTKDLETKCHSGPQHYTTKVGAGILMRTLVPGDATNFPKQNDTCRIHYEIFLTKADASSSSYLDSEPNYNFSQCQKIDSSIDRDEPLLFRLFHGFSQNSDENSDNPSVEKINHNLSNETNQPIDIRSEKLQVLPGLDVAVGKMSLGQKADIIIPPLYAYGDEGHLPIVPPKATLKFVVELLDFTSL